MAQGNWSEWRSKRDMGVDKQMGQGCSKRRTEDNNNNGVEGGDSAAKVTVGTSVTESRSGSKSSIKCPRRASTMF